MGKFFEPLKHLDVSSLIKEIRNKLLALQQQEYDEYTLEYLKEYNENTLNQLAGTQPPGVPFKSNFSQEPAQPDQIIQIKNLNNALYLAEKVFEQLEQLNLSDPQSIIGLWAIREKADEASRLLLMLGSQIGSTFDHEISTVISLLDKFRDYTKNPNAFLTNAKHEVELGDKTGLASNTGRLIGHIIDQLQPAAGELNYDLLTWFSGTLPFYIEKARLSIESSTTNTLFNLPNVDDKDIANVVQQKLHKLSNSMQNIISTISRIKDPLSLITNLPALFSLPSHFKQIQPLLSEIVHEVEHLEDTIQHLVHEFLAKLKYEALPGLFATVDKFEREMLLEPGRLSIPLMDQIKPLHELLIQIAKEYLKVGFDGKAEQLLYLEDSRFIDLRLTEVREQINHSKQQLHQIALSRVALKNHLDAIKNQDDLAPSKKVLADYLTLLWPYLDLLDNETRDQLKQLTIEPLKSTSGINNVSAWLYSWFETPEKNPLQPALNKLELYLQQMETDQHFRLKRNNELLNSVYSKSNMVVCKHKKNPNLLSKSEKEAFVHRHTFSPNIHFDENNIIINPKQLTDSEKWDLYQWYDNKVNDIQRVQHDCQHLLTLLKANKEKNKKEYRTSTIVFQPDYLPCVAVDKIIQHQPNRFYINIENGLLKYEILEPLHITPCSLLKLSQVDPRILNNTQLSQLLGNHDGFIQYKGLIFYFDAIKLNVISLPHEEFLNVKVRELMDNLPEDKLQIVNANHPDFDLIAAENIRAVCKLYLMPLDQAIEAGYRNSYVWNREIKQLSYIHANGHVQANIALSAENQSRLIIFVEGKHLPKMKDHARKRREAFGLSNDDIDINYLNLTAKNLADFISPIACGWAWMPIEPNIDNLRTLPVSQYFRTKKALFYYSKEDDTLQKITLDASQVQQLDHEFPANTNIGKLSSTQFTRITSITGHTPLRGCHHPGLIRSGTISLNELDWSLTNASSITLFKPYLSSLYDKALERGHIHDQEHSDCIRYYSSVQPWLVEAFEGIKVKDVVTFDKDVVDFLSGYAYGSVSKSRPTFSYDSFRPQLLGLETELSIRQAQLQKKRDKYFPLIQHKIIPVESPPVGMIYHHQFSPDVAEFMLSVEPIKRQIHESSTTVSKVKLAREHLNKYCKKPHFSEMVLNDPNQNLNDKHYPWFQRFLSELKSFLEEKDGKCTITATQLQTRLNHIQYYEEAEIKRNKSIIDSVTADIAVVKNTSDLSEVTAFMYFAPEFKVGALKEGEEIKPNEFSVKILNGELHYKFLHYGQLLSGQITLKELPATFTLFDEKVQWDKKTLRSVLSLVYEQRKRQIQSDKSYLSFEEALDLSQWYRTIQESRFKLSDEKKQILENKIDLYEQYVKNKPPQIQKEPVNRIKKSDASENRLDYLIKQKKAAAAFNTIKESLGNHYAALTQAFRDELKPATSGVPFPENRTEIELAQDTTRSVAETISPAWEWTVPYPFLHWTTPSVPTIGSYLPSLDWGVMRAEDALLWLVSTKPGNYLLQGILKGAEYIPPPSIPWIHTPRQVLAYKRVMNIVYYLEKILEEAEKVKINKEESKLALVNHLLVSYLYAAEIYPLMSAISSDPHFSPFFRNILSKIDEVLKYVTDESEHYAGVEQVNIDSLYFMNVLKMLPERISLTSEDYKKKLPELKIASKKSIVNIEKIISDYHASFSYVRLFFDLPIILSLLNDLPKSITNFTNKINKRIKNDLNIAPPDFFLKIMQEADKWENTIGLESGVLSEPLKKILDEFYKGLITPLILDVDRRVNLLCDSSSVKKRQEATFERESKAALELEEQTQAIFSIQQLLNVNNTTPPAEFKAKYKQALPLFKKALNGSSLSFMSLSEAKKAGYNDSFIWDEKNSRLFYIDPEGQFNAQHGCELYLKDIPDSEPLNEASLSHTVAISHPKMRKNVDGLKKGLLQVAVNKPTLIKHGAQYFIYENSADAGWRFTELDADLINKMHLNFNQSTVLQKNKKYQDLYAEITAKTGWVYPIQLKSIQKFIEFITQKPRAVDEKPQSTYVSETEIRHFISSNSNFHFQKHGVSLPEAKGCCFVSLPTIPVKLDKNLQLPTGFSAYYVKVKGIYDALYYIDINTRLIQKLDVTSDQTVGGSSRLVTIRNNLLKRLSYLEQTLANSKSLKKKGRLIEEKEGVLVQLSTVRREIFESEISKIRKNKLMLRSDFRIIKSLTGHHYESDFIDNPDEFVPEEQHQPKLMVLATQCKNHYEELRATSKVAIKTAQEQQLFLKDVEAAQQQSNRAIKHTVFSEYFDNKIDSLCNESEGLHGYTLELLTEVVKIEPNHLYVNIRGNMLDYRVIDPSGVIQKGQLELSAIECFLERLDSANDLLDKLPAILKITSRRGDRHTRPYSLLSEYQAKLKLALNIGRDDILNRAQNSDSKCIDNALQKAKNEFDKTYLEKYRQLNALNTALDDFMLYLDKAENEWSTRYSLFESAETIRGKRSTLDHLNALASNENDDVAGRIEKIQTYLVEDATLEHLLNYANYDSNRFAMLFQLILRFFEAVGLYTPKVVQHVDKLLTAIEGPTVDDFKRPGGFLFFAAPVRKSIRPRADSLQANEKNEPKVDGVDGHDGPTI